MRKMVTFPVEGLDMSPYLVSKDDNNKDAIYDLFAICNHKNGMGGGRYTANAKSLDNKQWYYFKNSDIEKVENLDDIKTQNALILFYYKRKPNNESFS